jgi:hypothetical protein
LYYTGRYTSETSGHYLAGGQYKQSDNGGGTLAGGTHDVDSGRLIANRTYQYAPGFSPPATANGKGLVLLGTNFNVLKKTISSPVERFVTYQNTLPPNTWISSQNARWITGNGVAFMEGRTMHFHVGFQSMTGSAGCQTFPKQYVGEAFSDFVGKLKSFSASGNDRYEYVLKGM